MGVSCIPLMAFADERDEVVFYVPLWIRNGITVDQFDNYWRDVHGPVCSRLPGQMEYWQYHLSAYDGGIFPEIKNIKINTDPADQFLGVAELTFSSVEDRAAWFTASAILMDDEHNIFSKAIGYTTSMGNTRTVMSRLSEPYPNGPLAEMRYHVMIRKEDAVGIEEFRSYMTETLLHAIAKRPEVVQLRYHLFMLLIIRVQMLRASSMLKKKVRIIMRLLRSLLPMVLIVSVSSRRKSSPRHFQMVPL